MDELRIGKKILMLRKEKNITQEELALKVGVSAGAVSKWENGNSMPDISLLAPIARALDTTIDNLFSFERDISKETVKKIKDELTIIFMQNGYEAGETECEKYLNKYPNNVFLKLTLAELLAMYLALNKNYSEEIIKEKSMKCLELFNHVVESREAEYVPTALFHIASINLNLGNYKESEEAIKRMPKNIDPVTLYPVILIKQGKNFEAMKLCCNKLLNYLNNSCMMLIMLAEIYYMEANKERAFLNLDACYKIQKLFKMHSEMTAYKYVELNMKSGNKEEASKWFEIYVKEVITAEYDYENNPYFDNVILEIKPDMQKELRKKTLKSIIDEVKFNELKGMENYENAIIEAKSALKKI